MSATWAISSERQAIRCRMEYLKAILRQEPGWHERQKSTEIAEKMHSETSKLQVAIGIRAQTFLMSTSLIVGGVTIALVRGWKLAIILMSFIPVMFVTGLISNCINRKADSATDKISNRLSGNALEVL
jgi:ATP-binding cassette subfamily B (MDR/TAP) protein 1